jgi:hypothetical protein
LPPIQLDVEFHGVERLDTNQPQLVANVADSLARLELSEQDILSRLRNTEDSTVERKTASDYRDCLKTAVAFSNSLPVDDPGLIFVGVGNDGTVQENENLDSLQKKVSAEIDKVYPPIYPQMKVLKDLNGKQLLVIIVRGSENRPHFAGQSFIRDGSQSVPASATQFDRLVAERNKKSYEIIKWRGTTITFTQPLREYLISGTTQWEQPKHIDATVIDCTLHYVTLEVSGRIDGRNSYPLRVVELNFDDRNHRLELRLLEGPLPKP